MNHDEGVTSAVTRIAEQFVSIWNTHDMARLADIYADDADFVNVIGMRWKGANQIAQMHVKLHESRMRQTTLASEDLEKKFIADAVAAGFVGLKGHRSVGGIRVSMYNAMPLAGIKDLTDFMKDFAKENG